LIPLGHREASVRSHVFDDGRATRARTRDYAIFPARQAKEEKDGSGVGCVTHEPPLRMAERSPAAKQSIYAFKMAARNATHPIPRLPSPRPTCTPCRHSVPAKAFTPVEFSTSLSRMPPKLFNFGTQLLTANQPILPSVVREGVLPFASLALRNSSSLSLYLSLSLSLFAFLYLPLYLLYFFLLSRSSPSSGTFFLGLR